MRCGICDTLLTDFEATRRVQGSRQYIDLCNPCFKSIDTHLPVVERKDLMTHGDFDDHPCTEGAEELHYNNYRVLSSDEYIID